MSINFASSEFVQLYFLNLNLSVTENNGRKPTGTSVTEFCYKRVDLSLEKLRNIKIILFSNTRTVQIAKFPEISPEISHFLTNSAVVQMPCHAKA